MGEKSELKREYILKKAKVVFAHKGYRAVTMKDIVEACEISRGGLYLYFGSTEDIFKEILKLELESGSEEGEAPWTANTLSPSCTSAAATSSCVDNGLQPVAYISAPPAARHRHRRAVFASMWTLRAIFIPAKGWLSMKSFSMPASSGIWSRTHWIFRAPLSHRSIFRMWLDMVDVFFGQQSYRIPGYFPIFAARLLKR